MTAVELNIIKPKANIADYFFFLRPMLHPPVWTIIILGFYRAADTYSPRLWLLLLTSSAAAAWAYIVNQLSDIESDRLNRKLFFLPDYIISPRSARIMAGLMFVLTLAGGFMLGSQIGLLFVLGLFLGYAYSAAPFNLKARPMAGFLCNAIAHGILPFATGYIAAGGEVVKGFLYSIPYFFAVGGVFIGTTIPDYDGDRETGKITPAVSLGPNRAALMMTLCAAIAVIAACILRDWAMALAGGLSLPFYIISWRSVSERNSALAIKMSILLLSIAAAWFFWPYLIVIAGLILLTRIYYRWRFKMAYPRLT